MPARLSDCPIVLSGLYSIGMALDGTAARIGDIDLTYGLVSRFSGESRALLKGFDSASSLSS